MNEDYRHLTLSTLVDIREQNMKLHSLYEEYKKSIISFLDQSYIKVFSDKIDDIDKKTIQHAYKENNFWSTINHGMNAHRIALIDLFKNSSLIVNDDLIYLAVQDLNNLLVRYFNFDKESYYINNHRNISYVQYLYTIFSEYNNSLFQQDLLECLSDYMYLFTDEMYMTFYTSVCSYINEIVIKEIEIKQKRLTFDRESLYRWIINIKNQLEQYKKILYN
jgi:hypothetical protein